jgi:hypothetical protein
VGIDDVLIRYETRLNDVQMGMEQARLHHIAAAVLLVVVGALFLTLGLYAIRKQLPFWAPLLPIPIEALAVQRYRRYREAGSRTWRLRRFYDRAVKRVQGDWLGSGVTGEAFNDPSHAYANDLGIFGEGSLFELICVGRSGVGQRGLANYLSEAPSLEETRARQEAVRELCQRTDLREKVALLGPFEFSESKWETFTDWLDSPAVPFPGFLGTILLISSALLVIIMIAGLALGGTIFPWISVASWMTPFILFHAAVGLTLQSRVKRMIHSFGALSSETQLVREGLQMIESQQFTSAKLCRIADRVRTGSASIRKLERRLNALHERNKDWFYLPSHVLALGTQLCIAIEQWRAKNGSALRAWLEAWAEFEALNALACYAYENPDNTFPELVEGDACFEARATGHPLLPHQVCVPNDVRLNRRSRFYIVSGSNMSGKSTLLRTIGLNAVLALAGAPVRAQSLRMSRLSVCASLAVVDSLLSGKSKFLAEVDRLRQAIELASGNSPVLFLVDEIFSGTNSRDRRTAAEAVVRTLVDRGAIGALSTHDLALSEIADDGGAPRGENVHMGSKGKGDPMDFDYLLKPGVTQEANALAIARMAGVPV